jgi:DNA-binding FadR family transcriptional regulator
MTAAPPATVARGTQHREDSNRDEPEEGISDLHEDVVRRWGQDIVSGILAPGACIIAMDAAEQFGVSRTVVREAVRVLQSLGLLTVRRRVGITVLPPDRWNVFDLRVIRWQLAGPNRAQQAHSWHELRSTTEPLAARLAAHNATPEQCGALAAAVIEMSSASRTTNTYWSQSTVFRQVLFRSSGNHLLTRLADMDIEVRRAAPPHPAGTSADLETLRLYGVVATAIQSWDADTAEQAMLSHHGAGPPRPRCGVVMTPVKMLTQLPVLLIMGVSGCGKSTVASCLADRLDWDLQVGDNLHPATNLARMSAGIPSPTMTAGHG